jgi:hypothetical protein
MSTTQIVSVAGSAQQSVPVELVCPSVRADTPAPPACGLTANASPRGFDARRMWLRIMGRAVSGVRIVARSCRNSARNRASVGRAPSGFHGLLVSAWRAWR